MVKHFRVWGAGLFCTGLVVLFSAFIIHSWTPLYQTHTYSDYALAYLLVGIGLIFFGLAFLFAKFPIFPSISLFTLLISFSFMGGVYAFLSAFFDYHYDNPFPGASAVFLISIFGSIFLFSLIYLAITYSDDEKIEPIEGQNNQKIEEIKIKVSPKQHLYILISLMIIFITLHVVLAPLLCFSIIISWVLGALMIFELIILNHMKKLSSKFPSSIKKEADWDKFDAPLAAISLVALFLLFIPLVFFGSADDMGFLIFLSSPSFVILYIGLWYVMFIFMPHMKKRSHILYESSDEESGQAPPFTIQISHPKGKAEYGKMIFSSSISIILILVSISGAISIEKSLNELNDVDLNDSSSALEAFSRYQSHIRSGEDYKADHYWIYSISDDFIHIAENHSNDEDWFYDSQRELIDNMTQAEHDEMNRIIDLVEASENVIITNSSLIRYRYADSTYDNDSQIFTNTGFIYSDYYVVYYAGLEIDERWFITDFNLYRETPSGTINVFEQTSWRELTIEFGDFQPLPRIYDISLFVESETYSYRYEPLVRFRVFENESIVGHIQQFSMILDGNYTLSLYYNPSQEFIPLSGPTNATVIRNFIP